MKFCSKCGNEIKEGAKFCPACGAQQGQVSNNGVEPVQQPTPVEPVEQPTQQSVPPKEEGPQFNFNEQILNNEKVQQFTVESKNYFKWLNKNIAKPQVTISTDLPIFGLINYILILLFSSLAFSRGMLSSVSYYFNEAAFPLVFEIILSFACYLVVGVLVVYILSDKIYKTKTSFIQAFDKVFAPASLAVYVSFASFIFSLLMNGSSLLFTVLLFTPFLLVNLSVMINIYHTKDTTGKRNRYYVSMLAIVVYSIIMFIVFIMISNLVFSAVSNSFNIDRLFDFF